MAAIETPPTPADPAEALRWTHTRLRRRLLSGQWKDDLTQRLQDEIGTVRREAWGVPKITANPFKTMCRELAALYSVAPEVRAPGGDLVYGPLANALDGAGLWSRMPRYQGLVIGCREYLWRLNANPDGSMQYRPVPPDLVTSGSTADAPDVPMCIKELRLRNEGWCWDILDISDPAAPVYRVETDKGRDVSLEVLGGDYSGDAYPYRRSDGTPILPYVLHHADNLGDRLWDYLDGVETLEATLDLAVNYTMLGHVIKDASWPQRFAINARPVGAGVIGDTIAGARQEVVTDPATLLLFEQTESSGQPVVSQLSAGADAEMLEGVISALANRIAIDAGLPPADIQRMGGTAKSGYAIALSNEGKRVAARRFAPSFRRWDQELVAKTAILLNRATGSAIPESGYSVLYRDLPLSPDELASRRSNILELLTAGLISPVDAYQELHPGMSVDAARADLNRIRQERALLATPL